MRLGCWKWFNAILKEAGVEVTDENSEKIEEVIQNSSNNPTVIGIGENLPAGEYISDSLQVDIKGSYIANGLADLV